jgi:hypothetical protein
MAFHAFHTLSSPGPAFFASRSATSGTTISANHTRVGPGTPERRTCRYLRLDDCSPCHYKCLMLRPLALWLLAAAPLLYAQEHAPVSASSRASAARYGLEKLPCTSFSWNSERNVMHVPISMNGKLYKYQLDTGADEVIPYGKTDHEGWTPKHEGTRVPGVSFAGTSLPAIVAYRFPQVPDVDVQGTVGLDLLMGRVFVIDFPAQQVCLFSKADLPDALDVAADWSPAEVRHGKFFLTLEFDGHPLKDIFYDTGSSPSTLLVDYPLWQQLTKRHSEADAKTQGDAESWGKQQHVIGAPAIGTLKLGTHTFQNLYADTRPSKPDDFEQSDQAQGLLGNALFMKSIVILDLGSHAQFGLITDPH